MLLQAPTRLRPHPFSLVCWMLTPHHRHHSPTRSGILEKCNVLQCKHSPTRSVFFQISSPNLPCPSRFGIFPCFLTHCCVLCGACLAVGPPWLLYSDFKGNGQSGLRWGGLSRQGRQGTTGSRGATLRGGRCGDLACSEDGDHQTLLAAAASSGGVTQQALHELDKIDESMIEQRFASAVSAIERARSLHEALVASEQDVRGLEAMPEEDAEGAQARPVDVAECAQALARVLDARVHKVVAGILQQVAAQRATQDKKSAEVLAQERKCVALLVRLEQAEHAHDLFLASRTVLVLDAIDGARDIARTGGEARRVLVAELCTKVLSLILQTVEDWRDTLGTGARHRARLLCWCVDLVSAFIARLGTEVCATADLAFVGWSVLTAYDYSGQLSKRGICLDFVVGRALFGDGRRPGTGPVGALVSDMWQPVILQIKQAVADEDWVPVTLMVSLATTEKRDANRTTATAAPTRRQVAARAGDMSLHVSASMHTLWSASRELLLHARTELCAVFSWPQMRAVMVRQVHAVAELYVDQLEERFHGLPPGPQQLTILSNAKLLATSLLPVLFALALPKPPSSAMAVGAEHQDGRALAPLSQRILTVAGLLEEGFLASKVVEAQQALDWGAINYTTRHRLGQDARPSANLQRLFAKAAGLGEAVSRHLGPAGARLHVAHVLQRVVTDEMLSAEFWKRYLPHEAARLVRDVDAPCGFGHGGVQQFVLDLRYVQAASRGVIPDEEHPVRVLLRESLERAVVGYCMAFDEDIDTLLLSDDWHEDAIHRFVFDGKVSLSVWAFTDARRD